MFLNDIFEKETDEVIEGPEVDLRFENSSEACARTSWVQVEYFAICKHGSKKKIGETDLRLGMNKEVYYAGNLGYRIFEPFRGHHYAYEACRLLFNTARDKYGMDELIITCSPENTASRKTLEELGGELLEVVNVPEEHFLYRRGEKVKNIYRFKL